MRDTKSFLSVSNLKKYYKQTIQEERPKSERGLFRPRIKTTRATVKAVDGVSFDLALGETWDYWRIGLWKIYLGAFAGAD